MKSYCRKNVFSLSFTTRLSPLDPKVYQPDPELREVSVRALTRAPKVCGNLLMETKCNTKTLTTTNLMSSSLKKKSRMLFGAVRLKRNSG